MQDNTELNKKILRVGARKNFYDIIDKAFENVTSGLIDMLFSAFVKNHVKKGSMRFVINFIENYKVGVDKLYSEYFEDTVAKYFNKKHAVYPLIVEKTKEIMGKAVKGVDKLLSIKENILENIGKEQEPFEVMISKAFVSKQDAEEYVKDGIFALTNGVGEIVKSNPSVLDLPFFRGKAIHLMEEVAVCSNKRLDELLVKIYGE